MAVSAQRRRRVLVAVVAALIAAGAFYLAIEYTNKAATTTPAGTGAVPTPAPVVNATVVVASSAIPAGTELSATNLKTASVPVDVLSVLTAAGGSDYPTVAALTATKEYAATAIVAGLPILSAEITSSPNAVSVPVGGTNFNLPAGDVALSLPYSPNAGKGEIEGDGTGGYIQAGDRVDILVEVDPIPNPNNELGTMYWAYENVPVLAVGASTGAPVASSSASPAASSGSTATVSASLLMVQLPRQDAADLAYMEDASNVTLQYLIVSPGDYSSSAEPVPTPGTQVIGPVNASTALTDLEG